MKFVSWGLVLLAVAGLFLPILDDTNSRLAMGRRFRHHKSLAIRSDAVGGCRVTGIPAAIICRTLTAEWRQR